jgi:hypothetical protein
MACFSQYLILRFRVDAGNNKARLIQPAFFITLLMLDERDTLIGSPAQRTS